MKTETITESELENMRQEVLKQLKFAENVQANTKQLLKQLRILTLAKIGLYSEK